MAKEGEGQESAAQEEENALLQQALAMSMDDPAARKATRDIDMSEAVGIDQDLALGMLEEELDQTDINKLLVDQSFVSLSLASLPGVDRLILQSKICLLLCNFSLSLRRRKMEIGPQMRMIRNEAFVLINFKALVPCQDKLILVAFGACGCSIQRWQ